ncbi:MAG: phosphotransferase [Methylococcaceae bacterium]|nr:phosphotransferase [Methylococcaceae bacterium]
MTNSPDLRFQALSDWLRHDLRLGVENIVPASSDASFRRYFRAAMGEETYIVMDAPPPHEDVRPFIKISGLLREAGVQAPQIHAQNIDQGFLLLCDFGNRPYLDSLEEETADSLYGDAMENLIRIKQGVRGGDLPVYDARLLHTEMDLFRDWFLVRLLEQEIGGAAKSVLEKTWASLAESALEQPRVCVHRDYHSRNLMVTEQDNPGVLDFQDAVEGPISYDLVSLLRDCYIAWPQERVEAWVCAYYRRLQDAGLLDSGEEQFMRWFDLMGLQRHLKAIGIFSRLKLRDGKGAYLGDIPRTLNYVVGVCERYPELADFLAFLRDGGIDRFEAALGQST